MKNLYSKIACLIGILFLNVAANTVANGEGIAVVNQQIVIESSLCGKNYQETMQKEFDSKQSQLNAKKDILKKKYEALQKDKDILSKKDLKDREQELEKLQQELQKMHDKFENELGEKDQDAHQKINKLFMQAVANIGKINKYDVVLPINVTFYYSKDIKDITTDVTNELDKVYKENGKK